MQFNIIILIFVSLFLLRSASITAQYNHVAVHTSDSGQVLLNKLVTDYKPPSVFSFSTGKDLMFSNVFAQNDSVECIYSGYKRFLAAGDPSVVMYDGGNTTTSIDTEHAFPQDKGASSGNANSDLHHLFPTRATINSSRGSLPFNSIPANNVDKWFEGNQTITATPALADQYRFSKLQDNVRFEPRDASKGDIARAVFYFYTMYKSEADAADPTYFSSMLTDICTWHINDPVDSSEWERTYKIAQMQHNRPNPFVLDCTLAQRTYCSMISCTPPNVSVDKIEDMGLYSVSVYPNPVRNSAAISYHLNKQSHVQIEVYDAVGNKQQTILNARQDIGYYELDFNFENSPAGNYFCRIMITDRNKTISISKSILKLN